MAGRRITVLALDSIGDLTMRQPLLAGLVAAGFEVTLVVRGYVEGLVPLLHPALARVVSTIAAWTELPPDDARERLAALAAAIHRSAPDDVVAAAYNRTWLDDWCLALVPNARRVGLVDRTGPPPPRGYVPYGLDVPPAHLDIEVPCSGRDHEAVKNAALLHALTGCLPESAPALHLTDELRARGREIVRRLGLLAGKYVIGCPAGAINNAFKIWPIDAYATVLTETFRTHGFPTLLVGVESERPMLEAVRAATDGASTVWCGGRDDLGELTALIGDSRLYVGADTGPMHLAGAVGVPVVANIGGAHWPRFLPLARPAFLATQQLPCFGCGWSCRFGTPRCIVHRSEPFRDGIRWILSGAADGLRIDTGIALDAATIAAIEQIPAGGTAAPDVVRHLDRILGRPAPIS